MKMKKRLFAWLLVLLLALPLGLASAATTKYLKSPNGKKINLRHGPNEQTYAVAIQLDPGTAVSVLKTSKGWATVRYQGHTLYVQTKYLTSSLAAATSTTSSSSASSKTRYLVSKSGRKINLRHGPNEQTYAVAVQVPSGTEVQLLSTSNGWAKVRYQGYTLYVKSSFVSSKSASAPATVPAVKEKVRYIKSPDGKKVNLRHGPSEKGYAIAIQLEHGTQVGLISSSKGWAKVRYQGRVLYVMTKYLTATAPKPID